MPSYMTQKEAQDLRKVVNEFDYHNKEFRKGGVAALYGLFGSALGAQSIAETIRDVGNKGFQYLLQDPKSAIIASLVASFILSFGYGLKKVYTHEPKRDELIGAAIHRKDLEEYQSEI
jgi:hypothetical protein